MKFIGHVTYTTTVNNDDGTTPYKLTHMASLLMDEGNRRELRVVTTGLTAMRYGDTAARSHDVYGHLRRWQDGGPLPPYFKPHEDVLLEMLNKMVQHKLTGDEL